jgi:hypothetical protein
VKLLAYISLFTLALTNQGLAQKFFETERVEDAQVKIYAVDDPKDADLLVFFVYEDKDVTKTGIWMEVDDPKLADVLLIFVDVEAEADLKIWLVDTFEESKWINEKKKSLLKIKPPKK